jgi:hypothetical protein
MVMVMMMMVIMMMMMMTILFVLLPLLLNIIILLSSSPHPSCPQVQNRELGNRLFGHIIDRDEYAARIHDPYVYHR